MRAFPITGWLDEQARYEFLLSGLHPTGLRCPAGHKVAAGQAPQMRDRAPVVEYRGRRCGKGFTRLTNTCWKGRHYSGGQVVLLVRGFAQGVPRLPLARELRLDYETVLPRRHSWQEQALKKSPTTAARPSHRSGRNGSECGRKRHAPARSGRRSAVSRQPSSRLGDPG